MIAIVLGFFAVIGLLGACCALRARRTRNQGHHTTPHNTTQHNTT